MEAVDSSGNVYVADYGNHMIRKITSAGNVTTFAGKASTLGSSNEVGTNARFNEPVGVSVDSSGNVYVGERNHLIRKLTPLYASLSVADATVRTHVRVKSTNIFHLVNFNYLKYYDVIYP